MIRFSELCTSNGFGITSGKIITNVSIDTLRVIVSLSVVASHVKNSRVVLAKVEKRVELNSSP